MSTKLTKLVLDVIEACVSRDANYSTNAALKKKRSKTTFGANSKGWLYVTTLIPYFY